MSVIEEHSLGSRLRLLPFANGDRLDQPTFHALYLQAPEGIKAELLGGLVFKPPPISKAHGQFEAAIKFWLGSYAARTPGVQSLGTCSVILGPEDEPEPDAVLCIDPEHGGRCHESGDFLIGAPELAVEVANSSAAMDLLLKKRRYADAGIDEYLVVSLAERKVHWFRNEREEYGEMASDNAGVIRSSAFPGLWLNVSALFQRDLAGLAATLDAGVRSDEHRLFVEEMAARKRASGENG